MATLILRKDWQARIKEELDTLPTLMVGKIIVTFEFNFGMGTAQNDMKVRRTVEESVRGNGYEKESRQEEILSSS